MMKIINRVIAIILICQLTVISCVSIGFADDGSFVDKSETGNMPQDEMLLTEDNTTNTSTGTECAEDGDSQDDTNDKEDLSIEQSGDEDAPNNDEIGSVLSSDGLSAKKQSTALSSVKNVKAFAGYKAVILKWNEASDAESYCLYRKSTPGGKYNKIESIEADGSKSYIYRDTKVKKDNTYKYYVTAVTGDKESKPSVKVSGAMVRTIYYKLTAKSKFTLKSSSDPEVKTSFDKGDKIVADGFKKGHYITHIDGNSYKVEWYRIKNPKVDYKKNAYGKSVNNVTAEDYINQANYSSKTKYLIWISLYTQRIFVFKGKKGKWDCIKSWQCNSGKASTPTESGTDRKIYAKYAKNSKHKYWSRFSRLSSIHGRNSGDAKLGKPVSGGCVRIDNSNAIYVMKEIPYKTRVVVY